ncbi:MAG: ammonia channel protein [Polyangiaceae bacterium]
MYQLMFAIITPALIVGAIAERMKYSALMLFMVGWMFLVYFPLAHMVWGIDGFMNGVWNANASIKAIDFAGGTVVHMTSGWSAIVLALILGKRKGFGKRTSRRTAWCSPWSAPACCGSAGTASTPAARSRADGVAANAFTTTTLAAAVAGAAWPALEWITRGKPTVLGFCSGIVGGLVVITPAAGFVTASGASSSACSLASFRSSPCTKLKQMLGYDDALDTFGVHGVGGTFGAFVTGIFATPDMNANLDTNLKGSSEAAVARAAQGDGLHGCPQPGGTVVLAYAIKAVMGLRPTLEDEETGLDLSDHGEKGYHLGET